MDITAFNLGVNPGQLYKCILLIRIQISHHTVGAPLNSASLLPAPWFRLGHGYSKCIQIWMVKILLSIQIQILILSHFLQKISRYGYFSKVSGSRYGYTYSSLSLLRCLIIRNAAYYDTRSISKLVQSIRNLYWIIRQSGYYDTFFLPQQYRNNERLLYLKHIHRYFSLYHFTDLE